MATCSAAKVIGLQYVVHGLILYFLSSSSGLDVGCGPEVCLNGSPTSCASPSSDSDRCLKALWIGRLNDDI